MFSGVGFDFGTKVLTDSPIPTLSKRVLLNTWPVLIGFKKPLSPVSNPAFLDSPEAAPFADSKALVCCANSLSNCCNPAPPPAANAKPL